MNYSIRGVGGTVLHLFARVESSAVLRGGAYCSITPPALVHPLKSQRELSLPCSRPRMFQQSEGRGTIEEMRMTHIRKVSIPVVCGSPHAADVVRAHVAALVAVKCFGKFWEILKGSKHPEIHTEEIVAVLEC